ncbi:hypothetical protein [Pseudomonas putida]|uniref:Uncharacterized protein n=1 Tax=Pseudomonas putida TaxID=303 RepID=A0AAW4BNI2_PSEPU|nr:hypothetical protein [Pseudomonas putida]MBF8700127.1 hypothetical protein [Pseudomonas putida]MBF8734717.1 hypothetical protein [Pseudomonas putida]
MIKADFTAELHTHAGRVVVAESSIGQHPFTWLDEDGWLCVDNHRNKHARDEIGRIAFDFTYIKSEKGRDLYYISCNNHWKFAGARLEQNPRGWLGLYGTGVIGRVTDAVANFKPQLAGLGDYWKIDAFDDWDGDLRSAEEIPFYLRDKHGHRVASTRPEDASTDLSLTFDRFLNASATPGQILTFYLKNIRLA